MKRFTDFIVHTIDYIADPTVSERKIPVEMFSISQILSTKIKNSYSEEFMMI